MRRTIKVLCIVAAVLFCLGCVLVGGAVATARGGWAEVVQWVRQPLRLEQTERGWWTLRLKDYYDRPQQQVYDSDRGVDTLELRVVSNDVELIPRTDLDHIRITYYLRYAEEYGVEESRGRLTLSHPRMNVGGDINLLGFLDREEQHKTFTVEYPAGQRFTLLTLDGVNNTVSGEAVAADQVVCNIVNGGLKGDYTVGHFEGTGVNATYDIRLAAETAQFSGLVNSNLYGGYTAKEFHTDSVNSTYRLSLDAQEADFNLVNSHVEAQLAGRAAQYAVFFEKTNSSGSLDGQELSARNNPDGARSIDISGVNSSFAATTAGGQG